MYKNLDTDRILILEDNIHLFTFIHSLLKTDINVY